tara:strand:- start:252 stop:428 length:177 start_codon:yes stop_codon:yes gene_type:complete
MFLNKFDTYLNIKKVIDIVKILLTSKLPNNSFDGALYFFDKYKITFSVFLLIKKATIL